MSPRCRGSDAVVLMAWTQGRISLLSYCRFSERVYCLTEPGLPASSLACLAGPLGLRFRDFAAIKFAISSSFPQAFTSQASDAILEAAIHFNGRHSKPVRQVITSPLLWHNATCALRLKVMRGLPYRCSF